jgi:uncharacterized protein
MKEKTFSFKGGIHPPYSKELTNSIALEYANEDVPTWNKPAFACLSSRFPYGQEITADKLKMVDLAEELLLGMGFRQIRVRHHGKVARIEVAPEEREEFFNIEIMDTVGKELKKMGFTYVTLDILGYRTGSMNEVLK